MSARNQPILAKLPQQNTPAEAVDADHENKERIGFYHDLHNFMSSVGQPIQRLPTLGFKELDLWILYKEVTGRRGVDAVIAKKQWKEVADALRLPPSCTDSGFRLRLHYLKYLEPYERAHFVPPPEMPQVAEDKRQKRGSSTGPEKRKRPHDGNRSLIAPKFSRKSTDLNAEGSSLSSLVTTTDSPAAASQESSPYANDDPRKGTSNVNFSKLEVPALRKYRKHYKLQGLKVNPSKTELVAMVSSHFAVLPPPQDEKKILAGFMSAWEKARQ
ncbi:hypothetical protein NDN08_002388 [Rhodosorus marinus]|uniref:ARID domain-containing protein n=1 Tax=Rhodosorus marinus TaxID=101924 RepID=A0AAV8UTK4_9RHOD|nr:hypothetical protein NDN08_002388 [Rhodosorus marinus]